MNRHDVELDPALTSEQLELVAKLSATEIKEVDNVLLSNACQHWRKVVRIVGTIMFELPGRTFGIPDAYYVQRVRYLVKLGLLESQGNLSCMRYSEVRLPSIEEMTNET